MEGPGVLVIKEKLEFLKGKIIEKVSGNTKEDKEKILNKRIVDIKSFGKRLIFDLEDVYLIIHFLMYGSFRINEKIENKKERLQILVNNNIINFYNTSVKIVEKSDFNIDERTDVMSNKFDKNLVKNKVKNYEGFVCDVLLDQNIFSGVGNIIKNEALFRAKIHPLSIAKNLDEKIVDNLIEEVIRFSNIFYLCRKRNKPLKDFMLIYGKRKCPSCNSKVRIMNLGKYNRRTYYCENCQILYK
ncbi:MAG: DNA-formamidopyrimidine glycosylase family protein [Candidatus Aenigmatarchaeota archaeon]